MSASEPASAMQRRSTARDELCIVVACHTFVCAMPVRAVERLVLNDDVAPSPGRDEGWVECNGESFIAANLGTLLDVPDVLQAWALLRVPSGDAPVPIALRTGACLMVRPVAVQAPLPGGLFERHGSAVLGAFAAGTERGFPEHLPYGLVIDPHRFWSASELVALRERLTAPRSASDG